MSEDFFFEVVKAANINKSDKILSVCGGSYDRQVLLNCGMEVAVISNVSHHAGVREYAPYDWEYQDAEALKCEDDSFDWAIVHAGLHHCASPHKALCEMLRVSKNGVIVVEARDSMVVRLANKLGISPQFELEPALLTNGKSGGYRDTPIPNYIYRWTEREVLKTVESFEPHLKHSINFHYGWRLPIQRMSMSRSKLKKVIVRGLQIIRPVLKVVLRKQGNCFGFIIQKSGDVKPWIRQENNQYLPDLSYIAQQYEAKDYKR